MLILLPSRDLPADKKDVFESDFENTDEGEEESSGEVRDPIAERYVQEE